MTTNYLPVDQDIIIIQGDIFTYELDVSDTEDDLTGITFTATLNDGTSFVTTDTRDDDGLVTFSLTSTQTNAITSRIPLHWKVRRSDEITVITGTAFIIR